MYLKLLSISYEKREFDRKPTLGIDSWESSSAPFSVDSYEEEAEKMSE